MYIAVYLKLRDMTLSEFIIVTSKERAHEGLTSDLKYTETKPRIYCNDGFNLSVQAGIGMYSTPRKTAKSYSTVEVGFPSEPDEMLASYAEDIRNQTETVYPYTDFDVVNALIEKHGGIDVEKTFRFK